MNQGTIARDRRLERLRHELEEQAQVFEDPGAYLAGVEDVFAAIGRVEKPTVIELDPDPDELPPPGGWFG